MGLRASASREPQAAVRIRSPARTPGEKIEGSRVRPLGLPLISRGQTFEVHALRNAVPAAAAGGGGCCCVCALCEARLTVPGRQKKHDKLVVKPRPTRNRYTRFLWCASTATPTLARKRREIFSSTISLGSCSRRGRLSSSSMVCRAPSVGPCALPPSPVTDDAGVWRQGPPDGGLADLRRVATPTVSCA